MAEGLCPTIIIIRERVMWEGKSIEKLRFFVCLPTVQWNLMPMMSKKKKSRAFLSRKGCVIMNDGIS